MSRNKWENIFGYSRVNFWSWVCMLILVPAASIYTALKGYSGGQSAKIEDILLGFLIVAIFSFALGVQFFLLACLNKWSEESKENNN